MKDEGPSPAELLVVVRGGDDPSIDLRKVGTSESVRRLTGRRDAVKAPPKGLDWTFDGTSLVLTAHGATYTFAF